MLAATGSLTTRKRSAYVTVLVTKAADLPGTPVSEFGQVEVDPLPDSSPNAAGPSSLSGTSGDCQTIGVSRDTDSQSILSKTPAWPSEADEFMAFSPESGKFLSGPGVIPAQGAIPMPQVIGHGQDTQTPLFDQVASFDDPEVVTIDQPPLEGQGA